jgi:hypothetical protein
VYPGHFAAGLAIKTLKPESPTWGIMVGVGLLDWLFGVFVMFGIEGGTYSHLDIPWSHSLAMSLAWSILFAALFWRRGRGVMLALCAAVMSHWVLDLASHHPDIGLWPHSRIELGLNQYSGGLAGWFEVSISVWATLWYVASARKTLRHGRHWGVVCGVMALAYVAEYLAVP